jgi:hypothetical protein
MIEIIDFRNVEIDGENVGDLVSAIANNLQSPRLSEIITALGEYQKSYKSTAVIEQTEAIRKQAEAEIAAIRTESSAKDATIEQLRTEIAPDIASLIGPLQEAGLTAWGDAAITAGENLISLVLRLLSIASQPRYWNQCQEIKDLFGAIGQSSGVWPTSEQATAMQAILDVGTAATGPVTAKWLDFTPWMG